MDYDLEESLASLSTHSEGRKIGRFAVKRDANFITFSPSIKYQGETLDRLRIHSSTFKHFGFYTLEMLFLKLLPSIDGHFYEEIPDPNQTNPAASVLFSTTVYDVRPNFDLSIDREYGPESQFRSHIFRVGHDQTGAYLDWPHLAPLRKKQYLAQQPKQSKEHPT